ncbi:MAG: hypothetical protein HY052_08240 [Proteobacteria bacterium]|nr:hypothetical protein [Pseudomonadota bacterium]
MLSFCLLQFNFCRRRDDPCLNGIHKICNLFLGARQAGRNAERVDQLNKIVEIKDAQLRATLDGCRV